MRRRRRRAAPSQPRGSSRVSDVDHERPHDDGSLRLSKRMSELGIASRREADEWIARGWVRVDGRVVAELGSRVLPEPAHHDRPARPQRAGPARHRAAQQAGRLRQRPGRGRLPAGARARHARPPVARGQLRDPLPAAAPAQPRSGRPARHRFGRPAGADAGRPRRPPADRRGQPDREGVPRSRRDAQRRGAAGRQRWRCCATGSSSTARRSCRPTSNGSTTTSCASSCARARSGRSGACATPSACRCSA